MKLTFDYELFGLEPRDMRIYEAMLTNPDATSIRTIAAAVNMNRGTTFEVIKKLVSLGLVAAYVKNTRKQYRAEQPDSIRRFAADRSRMLEDELNKVAHYVDQLQVLQPEAALQPFGKLYVGEDEIAALLQDVLTTVASLPDKTYRVISSAEVSNHMYRKFTNFTRQRIKQEIFVRVLAIGGTDELAEQAERKAVTTEQVPPSYIIMYGDKVAQITLTSLGAIQGSVTEDAGIAALQGLLFDALWDKL